jgi:hypothetical protein
VRQAEDAAAPRETAVLTAAASGASERLLLPPEAPPDERASAGDASRDAAGSPHCSRWLQGVKVPRKRAWADDELDFIASDVEGMCFFIGNDPPLSFSVLSVKAFP